MSQVSQQPTFDLQCLQRMDHPICRPNRERRDQRCEVKEKLPEGVAPTSYRLIVDQAGINAGFDLRRYAMKPSPQKPKIIMAQVEGSGTVGARDGAPMV